MKQNRYTHGGARKGAGAKKGVPKKNKTFSIEISLIEKKPTSKLVNDLLKQHYLSDNV